MKGTRRRFTAAIGTVALTGLAGCTGVLDGGNDDATGDDAGTDAIAPDDWPSFGRTPGNVSHAPTPGPTDEPDERWTIELPGAVGDQVAVVDGTVYACTDAGTVHAIDAASGEAVWEESVDGATSQCPCVVDDLIVFGTEGGELVALDADDGSREWATELAGPVLGPTAAEGRIYVGTREEPTVVAVDAADGELEWTLGADEDWIAGNDDHFDDGPVVTDYPAVVDDRVYVAVEGAGA